MERIEDLTYKAQQRQRQGRTNDAIRLFEQALEFRIDLHGAESSSVKKACDNLSDILNGAALKHLQVEEYEEARKLLQKAEMLTGPDDLISAVTYNNIACYYRRKNKLRTALKYLQKAQRIEMKSRVVANPAGTRLNLCAVLSQLERHHEALEHAQAAVVLLQEELSQMELNGDYHEDRSPETLNKMAVLAISYHNIGVEEEYMKRHAACLAAYKKGVQIAREYLGPDNDITRTLIKSCKAAQEHLDSSQIKKSLAQSGVTRHGEKVGGAYHALQQHNDTKRRAQSAGAQRSQSATPSWALDGDRSLSRPSTAHQAASSKSLSRARAWVDDDRNGDNSIMSAVFEGRPPKSGARNRLRGAQHEADGDAEENGRVTQAMKIRQRPASALGMSGGNSHSSQETGPGQPDGSMGAKRGPVTPRLEEGNQKVAAIRRPPSASLREPVRANLGACDERESLETKLKRVDEEEEQKQSKSYAWEEGDESAIDEDQEDFLDDDLRGDGLAYRRVTYGRPDREGSASGARPRDLSPPRVAEGLRAGSAQNVVGGARIFPNGGGRAVQLAPLDDDLLDEDYEVDDVDSGTEAIIQNSQQGAMYARDSARPSSATLTRYLPRAETTSRHLERPASASFAVIHERRQTDKAKRPSSAAPVHAAQNGKHVVARAASDSNRRPGHMLDGPARESERAKLRPASASFTRPASASLTRPGSTRPMTASNARPASANVTRPASRDPRQDEIACNNQREEREILDIVSDHSEYESDLELEAETRALSHASLHRPQNHSANVRPRDQGLEAKRVELLAKTELGLDHSLYESDENADSRGVLELEARSSAPRIDSRERYPTLEEINARVNDRQYQERQVVHKTAGSQRPQRPSDSGRAQRPSNDGRSQRPPDNGRAPSRPSRPSDSRRSTRESSSVPSFAPPGHLQEEMLSPSGSEYESDDGKPNGKRVPPNDMSGTLKWLEDGLTTRQD